MRTVVIGLCVTVGAVPVCAVAWDRAAQTGSLAAGACSGALAAVALALACLACVARR